jgi:hypothetical protein
MRCAASPANAESALKALRTSMSQWSGAPVAATIVHRPVSGRQPTWAAGAALFSSRAILLNCQRKILAKACSLSDFY